MIIGITDRITEIGPIEQSFANQGVSFRLFNTLDEKEFPEDMLAEVDALFVWHAKVTEYTASRLKRCRLVVRYGVGYDQVNGDALARRGIPLANNPSYCTEEVADTSVAMILALTRNIVRHDSLSRLYLDSWQENSLCSLRSRGCSIGLIGLGRIGSATALRLRPFGFSIVGYDPYARAGMEKVLGIHRVADLNELLTHCDIVSLHCPLTKETKGIINKALLSMMKEDAALINTARGKLLASLDDLYDHLRENPDFRIYLDVLPQEPPGKHPLIEAWRNRENWLSERLLINPHNAFHSDEANHDIRRDALTTAWNALKFGRFQNVVNDVLKD